jgi:hypothetical protein
MIQAASSLQFAEVQAVITRKDGRVENLGVIDSFESVGHKLKRWGRRVLPWLAIAVLATAAVRHPDEAARALPAATVITNAGHAIVANRMIGSGTTPSYIAWGTGAGTAAAADTTLFTEASEARVNGTASRVTTTVTNDTFQVVGTMTVAGADKTITNVGLFDASSSGNLYFKSDFTGLALLIGDSITFTIKVKFS